MRYWGRKEKKRGRWISPETGRPSPGRVKRKVITLACSITRLIRGLSSFSFSFCSYIEAGWSSLAFGEPAKCLELRDEEKNRGCVRWGMNLWAHNVHVIIKAFPNISSSKGTLYSSNFSRQKRFLTEMNMKISEEISENLFLRRYNHLDKCPPLRIEFSLEEKKTLI